MTVLESVLSAASFVPHGYCLLWRPELVALHALSDVLIFAAYISIPVAIYVFMARRPDFTFRSVGNLFAAFILLCGIGHLIDAGTLWFPYYGLEGLVKLATALVSVATAIAIWPLLPRALALPTPDQLRAANEQLRAEIDQRAQAEGVLEEYAHHLERSNKDLERFALVTSHDLREPLRAVSGYCEILQRRYHGKLDADADRFIGYAVEGAKRLQTLIEDLLEHARVGTSGRDFEPTGMAAVAERALDNLKTKIDETAATVEVGPLPEVEGDESELVALLQNLLDNAIKYRSEQSPEIRISAEPEGDLWLFTVRDNGIGIDPVYGERIFEIFRRLHARGTYPGNGVGLAICKRIVERHGGTIWLEPETTGSRFCFTLRPATATTEEEPDGQ